MPRPWKPLRRRANRTFAGYPIATVAFYGPNDHRATKVAAAIVPEEDAEPTHLERWLSDGRDVRSDDAIGDEVIAFVREHGARTIAMTEGILGCPHEEGIDYPEGEDCPECPFWAGRDRWSGIA